MDLDELVETLIRVFPRRVVEGQIAPHECPECRELRGRLTGIPWTEVPGEFIRDNADVLPLLSKEAYLAFLAAWLRQGVLEPAGEVASVLLIHLEFHPETAGFTVGQRQAVIEVARFLVRNDGWGPDDPNNLKSVVAIEHTWGDDAD